MLFSARTLVWLATLSTTFATPFAPGYPSRILSPRTLRGNKCGSHISPGRVARFEEQLSDARLAYAKVGPGDYPDAEIEVHWHVFLANETYEGGWLSRGQIAHQMHILNQAYAGSGFTFNAKLVNRVFSEYYFKNAKLTLVDSTAQDNMKASYRVGNESTLNIYTVSFETDEDGTLGYATFPHDYSTNPKDDGVVLRYTTITGGQAPFDIGHTLTHEVGHWLGLYHTFEGGCEGVGDGVNDTPPQNSSSSSNVCDIGRDSCPGGGVDPIHNFMDYSADACLTEFTPGQIERFRFQSANYRGIGAPEIETSAG